MLAESIYEDRIARYVHAHAERFWDCGCAVLGNGVLLCREHFLAPSGASESFSDSGRLQMKYEIYGEEERLAESDDYHDALLKAQSLAREHGAVWVMRQTPQGMFEIATIRFEPNPER